MLKKSPRWKRRPLSVISAYFFATRLSPPMSFFVKKERSQLSTRTTTDTFSTSPTCTLCTTSAGNWSLRIALRMRNSSAHSSRRSARPPRTCCTPTLDWSLIWTTSTDMRAIPFYMICQYTCRATEMSFSSTMERARTTGIGRPTQSPQHSGTGVMVAAV